MLLVNGKNWFGMVSVLVVGCWYDLLVMLSVGVIGCRTTACRVGEKEVFDNSDRMSGRHVEVDA